MFTNEGLNADCRLCMWQTPLKYRGVAHFTVGLQCQYMWDYFLWPEKNVPVLGGGPGCQWGRSLGAAPDSMDNLPKASCFQPSQSLPKTSLWGRVSPAHHFHKINVHHFAEVGEGIYCFLTDFSSHRPVFDSDFTLDFRGYPMLLVSEILWNSARQCWWFLGFPSSGLALGSLELTKPDAFYHFPHAVAAVSSPLTLCKLWVSLTELHCWLFVGLHERAKVNTSVQCTIITQKLHTLDVGFYF